MLHNYFNASLNLNLLRLFRIREVLHLWFPTKHSNLFKSAGSTIPPLGHIFNELLCCLEEIRTLDPLFSRRELCHWALQDFLLDEQLLQACSPQPLRVFALITLWILKPRKSVIISKFLQNLSQPGYYYLLSVLLPGHSWIQHLILLRFTDANSKPK